jgi:hypothetical protein
MESEEDFLSFQQEEWEEENRQADFWLSDRDLVHARVKVVRPYAQKILGKDGRYYLFDTTGFCPRLNGALVSREWFFENFVR